MALVAHGSVAGTLLFPSKARRMLCWGHPSQKRASPESASLSRRRVRRRMELAQRHSWPSPHCTMEDGTAPQRCSERDRRPGAGIVKRHREEGHQIGTPAGFLAPRSDKDSGARTPPCRLHAPLMQAT